MGLVFFCIAFQVNAQKSPQIQQQLDLLKKSYAISNQPALKKKIDSLEGLLNPTMVRLENIFENNSIEALENPHKIEERTNSTIDYSVLKKNTGFLDIGEFRINLSRFTNYSQEPIIKSLSFLDSLVYIAIVNNRGGDKFDTTIIRGKKPSPSLIKNLQKRPPSIDPYTWQEIRRKEGFGNDCPPGNCTHYFIAITKTNRLIKVSNPDDMMKILPRIKTGNDAFFQIVQNNSRPKGKYAKTKEGFLVLLNEKISNCPINYADVLYRVDNIGNMVQLGRVITKKTTLCN